MNLQPSYALRGSSRSAASCRQSSSNHLNQRELSSHSFLPWTMQGVDELDIDRPDRLVHPGTGNPALARATAIALAKFHPPTNVAFWHNSEVAARLAYVRCGGQNGQHLLELF